MLFCSIVYLPGSASALFESYHFVFRQKKTLERNSALWGKCIIFPSHWDIFDQEIIESQSLKQSEYSVHRRIVFYGA